jgi:formate-dependent nitrite reductase membrane component NrfD
VSRPELGTTRAAAAGGRSPYGRPIVKPPVWTPEIPLYFFSGGLGGGSAGLAFAAGLRGDDELARRAWAISLGALSVSPLLLISDLGVPSRFFNMLRVFKVTSPMSVGSWLLVASSATTGVAALHAWTGRLAAPARVCRPAAAALGMPLSTYTGALVANTAVPAWHEARHELPFLFAAGAAASAGASAVMAVPPRHAAAARRLTLLAVAAELLAGLVVERRAGRLHDAYSEGRAGLFSRAARVLTVAGAVVVAARGRSRRGALAGGALVNAGALCKRWNVFQAGRQSAADPDHTAVPQRERIARGETAGSVRRLPAAATGRPRQRTVGTSPSPP